MKVIQILRDLSYFIFGIDVSTEIKKNILNLKLIKRTPSFDTEKDDLWYLNLKIKCKFLDLINTSSYLTF